MRLAMATASFLLFSSRISRGVVNGMSIRNTAVASAFAGTHSGTSSLDKLISGKSTSSGNTSKRGLRDANTFLPFAPPLKSFHTSSTLLGMVSSETIDAPSANDAPSAISDQPPMKVNLLTVHQPEFEKILSSWGYPKFRAGQILHWVRDKGVRDFDEMNNIPKKLRQTLCDNATIGSLDLNVEVISKDGTRKRAYKLWDGQLIESVLMPYEDGRQTACISSQAGCAMGCVFCATGQMGFARQLTPDEIFEQVARFSAELKKDNKRLSNVVMMGMGEPLANYRNVMEAIRRMNGELGIGARKITVSTVGIVPNIRKLAEEDIQVRLAVSLHCSSEKERSELLPANKRYGGLDTLMTTVKDYIDTTNRRVTFEWALIENENDTAEVARELGNLLKRFEIRSDMCHINLIPLNPTGGFEGSPSGRGNVHKFVNVLEREFGIGATPRVRRGIDINAGCGQLTASVKKHEEKEAAQESSEEGLDVENSRGAVAELKAFIDSPNGDGVKTASAAPPIIGVYEDDEEEIENDGNSLEALFKERIRQSNELQQGSIVEFEFHDSVNLDEDDEFEDESYENDLDKQEAARLMDLVKSSFAISLPHTNPQPQANNSKIAQKPHQVATIIEAETVLVGPTTTILDDESLRKAKRRRKKLLKNLKAIDNLKEMQNNGKVLNQEQIEKIQKEESWKLEIESVEHNLQ
mmetsp:Transcript_6916/g.9922  ORF Transcript_6916/g.9922 Transcript_6916/m.9922 type:complete len:695 (+) Transcript_6916:127-2211(+)